MVFVAAMRKTEFLRGGGIVEIEDARFKMDVDENGNERKVRTGDMYIAERFTGPKLLIAKKVFEHVEGPNGFGGWIMPTTPDYSFDIHECVKVIEANTNTHNLTGEQMEKFVDAIGGDASKAEAELAGGELTTAQLVELNGRVGGLQDWPDITEDPKINFAVDCAVNYTTDEEEPVYDEKIYTEEVEVFRAHGSFA